MATLGEYLGAGASTTKLLLHLNGNSTDSSGNGNNGTDTNITYSLANGKFGQGAGFNGTSSTITHTVPNFGTGNFTISAWINTSQSWTRVIYGKTSNVDTDAGGYVLYLDSSNIYIFRFGTATNPSVKFPLALFSSGWLNCIVTRDGNTGYGYVNGSLVSTSASLAAYNQNSAGVFTLGTSPGSNWSPRFYSGKLDEVIVENVAWNAEKIKKYYTYSKGRFGIL